MRLPRGTTDEAGATPPSDASEAAEVVVLGAKAASAYGRPDLAARLTAVQRRLSDDQVLVVVTGDYKHGKSSLVNAILGEDLSPVDDDLATAVPLVVRHGPAAEAIAVLAGEDGAEDRREPLPVTSLRRRVLEGDGARAARAVELSVPSPVLAGGLALVDAPCAGGLAGNPGAMAMAMVPFADGVVFVTDSSAELTASEMSFLRRARQLCSHVVVVESKVDLHPHWRRITELDRGHLGAAGLEVPVVPVSARLRRLAMEVVDDALDEESGVPVLLDWWLNETAKAAGDRGVAEAARAVTEVTDLLRHQFEAERRALVDPAALDQLEAAVDQARSAVAEARAAGGRWAQILADAFADFSSDVDHDVRERIRDLCARSDTAIDAFDPASSWSEFERWLRAEVAEAVSAHCAWRHERLLACVARGQQVFGAEVDAALPLEGAGTVLGTEHDRAKLGLEVTATGLGSQAFTLLRNSVGGVVVFSVVGGLAGLAIAPPMMVGLGLVMGTKGLKDERRRQLAQRRAQGKVSARRYLDEVLFLLGKDSRDAVRAVQRDLREYFAARAAEALQGAKAALAAASEARAAGDARRTRRLADIDAELGRLDKLAGRAARLIQAPT